MINVQNIDVNECFKWCLVRYLNSAGHNPRRISKADKDFAKRLDFENIKLTIKFKVIHQISKNNFIGIGVLGYENQEKYTICVSKDVVKKNMLT